MSQKETKVSGIFRLGRPWGGVKVDGSVGDAEGHQSHLYRFPNLYYRLEAFREAATYAGEEQASSSVLLKPWCFGRAHF